MMMDGLWKLAMVAGDEKVILSCVESRREERCF